MATVRARHNLGFGSDLKRVPDADRTVYFSWDGETGNLSDWTGLSTSAPTVSTEFVHAGTNSMRCYYQILSPTPDHQDHNVYAYFDPSPALDHLFIRGYVYHKSPEVGGSKHSVQRKLYYIFGASETWWLFLTSDSQADGGLTFRVSTNDSNYGGSAATLSPQWDSSDTFWDTWRCVEMEVQLNTPGASDGIVNVWVDGTLQLYSTTAHIRGTDTTGMSRVRVGVQADRTSGTIVDEKRYWDDIVIASSYSGL